MTRANDFFGASNGSETFYSHKPSLILFTEGIKALADACQAYWLIDLIISHQSTKEVNLERFQVWELNRSKGSRFEIIATDGNGNEVVSQSIPFSDFQYDCASIWLVDGCLMLPCEY